MSHALMEYNRRSKSMIVAYLFLFFFGMLGFHRLYTGNMITGVILGVLGSTGLVLSLIGIGLLWVWIPAAWCFLDLLLTMGMVNDYNKKLQSELAEKYPA